MKKLLVSLLALGSLFCLTACSGYKYVDATEFQQGQLDDFVFWMTDDELNTTITMKMEDDGELLTYTMEIDGNKSKVTLVSDSKNEVYYEEVKDGKSIQYYLEDDVWKSESFDSTGSVLQNCLVFNLDYIVAEDFRLTTDGEWIIMFTETVDDVDFSYVVGVTFDEDGAPTLTMYVKVLFFTVEVMSIAFSDVDNTSVTLPTIE